MKPPTQLWMIAVLAAAAGCAALTPVRPAEQNAELRLDRGLAALNAGEHVAAFEDLAWVYSRCHGHEASSRAGIALAGLELDPRNDAGRPEVALDLLAGAILDPGTPKFLRPLAESAYLTGLALGAEPSDAVLAASATDRTTSVGTSSDAAALGSESDGSGAAAEADGGEAEARGNGTAGEGVRAQRAEIETAALNATRGDASVDPENDALPVYGCGAPLPTGGVVAGELPVLPGPSMAQLLASAEAERDSVAEARTSLEQELEALRAQLQATRAELERIRNTLKP